MDSFIYQTVTNSVTGKSDVATSCFYCEIFQGGFYDFYARNKTDFLPYYSHSGFDKIEEERIRNGVTYTYEIDRSDADLYPIQIERFWTKFYPVSFTKNFSVGQSKTISFKLPYSEFSYDISTGTFTGTGNFNFKISKGYLVRLYCGFFSDDYSANLYQDADGEHTIKQFTGIITNISNNEQDGIIEVNAIDYSTIFLNQLNYNYPDILSYRDAPEDTEDVLVGDQTYKSPIRIQPTNLFSDVANQQFIPAYDNWKVTDAIRDLCIKVGFPVERILFLFENQDKQRLGKSSKYPFMKSQSKYVQTSSNTVQEMVKIGGIDTEALDEAKYKFDFGKSIWDCMISICEDFGYKMYFDEDGKLNIRDVGVGTFYQNFTGTEIQVVENHVYGWLAQDISSKTTQTNNGFSSDMKIEARFISKDASLPACYISVFNGDTFLKEISLRALNAYDAEIVTIYEKESPAVSNLKFYTIGTAYLNCLYYYPIYKQNNPVLSIDTRNNVKISQSNLSSEDVRNQVISIGKPKAPEPLISKAIDFTSIYGGENVINSVIYYNGDTLIQEKKGDFFTNGKKDRYQKATLVNHEVYLYTKLGTVAPKILKIYIKQDPSYIGKQLYIDDGSGTVIHKTITSEDLTTQGLIIRLNSPSPYSGLPIRIYAGITNPPESMYFSEFEVFDYDPAYNYVGYQKELLIVKDNVSDKSSNDWAAKSLIEIHRGNCHLIEAEAIGMPFLKVGDSLLVYAPELGFANDKIFYVSAISETGNDISYIANLTLTAVPPTKSLQYIPDIDNSKFQNDIYDFTIQIKEKNNISGDAKGIIGGDIENISGLPGTLRQYKYGRMVAYDSINQKLYVLGGSTSWMTDTFISRPVPTKYFAIYDFVAKTWTGGEMPVAMSFGFACVYNGDLYVLYVNKIYKYTSSTSTWSEYSTVPSAGYNFFAGGAVIKNDTIYAIGGWTYQSSEYPSSGMYSFNITSKEYASLASINASTGYFLNQCVLSADGNYIYNYGGSYRDYQLPGPSEYHWDWHNRMYQTRNFKRYTIATNTWETIGTPTMASCGGTLILDSTGNIYIAGGYTNDGAVMGGSYSIYEIYSSSTMKCVSIGGTIESFGISSCRYGNKNIIVGEQVAILDIEKMKQNQNINIAPISDYCLFSFATTKRRKISILVKNPTKNEIYAWPLEETIVEPGVYKRENGIRWDFGLDFEQRFGDFVDKIFLYPNDSDDNYVYSTIYENLDITKEYDPATTHLKTPPFYIIRLSIKLDKYVLNTLGNSTVSSDVQMEIPITTHADMYKDGAFDLAIEDAFPTQAQIGGSVVAPLSVKKNGIVTSINDMIYVDVIVQTNDNQNVNQITQPKDEYGRYPNASQRNVITAALIDEIRWDLTDSSGLYVPVNSKYKFKIVNAFGVNGEAVKFTTSISDNLLPNPTFTPSSSTITVPSTKPGVSPTTEIVKTMTGWVSNNTYDSIFNVTPVKDFSWKETISIPKTNPYGQVIGTTTSTISKFLCSSMFGYNISLDTSLENARVLFDKPSTLISFKPTVQSDMLIYNSMEPLEFGKAYVDLFGGIEKVISETFINIPHLRSSLGYMENPSSEQDIYVSFKYQLYTPSGDGIPEGDLFFKNKSGVIEKYWLTSYSSAMKRYALAPVLFVIYKSNNGSYQRVVSDIIPLSLDPGSHIAGAKFTIPHASGVPQIDFLVGARFGKAFELLRTSVDPPNRPAGYIDGLFANDPYLGIFVDSAKSMYINPGLTITIDNFQAILGSEYREITYSTQPKDNNKTSTIFEVVS